MVPVSGKNKIFANVRYRFSMFAMVPVSSELASYSFFFLSFHLSFFPHHVSFPSVSLSLPFPFPIPTSRLFHTLSFLFLFPSASFPFSLLQLLQISFPFPPPSHFRPHFLYFTFPIPLSPSHNFLLHIHLTVPFPLPFTCTDFLYLLSCAQNWKDTLPFPFLSFLWIVRSGTSC